MNNCAHSVLSPAAQAVLEKACGYCGLECSSCEECDGPLFTPETKLFVIEEPEDKRINVGSGEDVVFY